MSDTNSRCGHHSNGRVSPIDAIGCTVDEKAILHIARLFFRSFASPQTQSWMTAFSLAQHSFGGRDPEKIAVAVMKSVQTMGKARSSGFNFSNPDCAECSGNVTDHERQFISVLSDLRQGHRGTAHINAMLLCEGNDFAPFLDAMGALEAMMTPPLRSAA